MHGHARSDPCLPPPPTPPASSVQSAPLALCVSTPLANFHFFLCTTVLPSWGPPFKHLISSFKSQLNVASQRSPSKPHPRFSIHLPGAHSPNTLYFPFVGFITLLRKGFFASVLVSCSFSPLQEAVVCASFPTLSLQYSLNI